MGYRGTGRVEERYRGCTRGIQEGFSRGTGEINKITYEWRRRKEIKL